MKGDGGHIDLGDIVDAERSGSPDLRDAGREIRETAAVENVVCRERHDLRVCPIDADPRTHLERVTLDAALELLKAVMSQADRMAWEKYRRQRHVQWKRRVIAAAEAAADIAELG